MYDLFLGKDKFTKKWQLEYIQVGILHMFLSSWQFRGQQTLVPAKLLVAMETTEKCWLTIQIDGCRNGLGYYLQ